jgi:hypothetical protein
MKQQLDDKIDLSQVPYETVVEIFNSKLSGIIPNALNLLQLSKYTTSDKKISIPLQTDDFRIEFADVGTSFDFETNPTQKIRFSIAMQQSSDRSAKQEVVGAIGGYPIDDPQHSLYINMNLYKGDLSKK